MLRPLWQEAHATSHTGGWERATCHCCSAFARSFLCAISVWYVSYTTDCFDCSSISASLNISKVFSRSLYDIGFCWRVPLQWGVVLVCKSAHKLEHFAMVGLNQYHARKTHFGTWANRVIACILLNCSAWSFSERSVSSNPPISGQGKLTTRLIISFLPDHRKLKIKVLTRWRHILGIR